MPCSVTDPTVVLDQIVSVAIPLWTLTLDCLSAVPKEGAGDLAAALRATLLISAVKAVMIVVVVAAPAILFQHYGTAVLCGHPELDGWAAVLRGPSIGLLDGRAVPEQGYCMTIDSERSWLLPALYGYIQHKYWGNGPFQYWELKQIPNFALAAPIVAFTARAVWGYFSFWSCQMITFSMKDGPRAPGTATLRVTPRLSAIIVAAASTYQRWKRRDRAVGPRSGVLDPVGGLSFVVLPIMAVRELCSAMRNRKCAPLTTSATIVYN